MKKRFNFFGNNGAAPKTESAIVKLATKVVQKEENTEIAETLGYFFGGLKKEPMVVEGIVYSQYGIFVKDGDTNIALFFGKNWTIPDGLLKKKALEGFEQVAAALGTHLIEESTKATVEAERRAKFLAQLEENLAKTGKLEA